MNMVEKIVNSMGIKGILTLTFLEYACFPIPSEFVLPMLGYVSSSTSNYLLLVILSLIVSLIACIILYCIGYYGGSLVIDKIYNKYKKSKKGIDICKQFISKHTKITLILARMIPLTRTYISLVAGTLKCPFYTYLFTSMIGIGIWNSILIGMGYAFVSNIDSIAPLYNKYKILILLLLSVSIIMLLYKKFKNKEVR